MHIGTLSGWAAKVLLVLLGHVALQAHLVQGPLVLACHGLHDGGEEGLGVEEAGQPDAGWHVEVRDPVFQFPDPQEEVSVPYRKAIEGWVGTLGPGVRDLVEEEGILKALHVSSDGQLALGGGEKQGCQCGVY